MFVLVELKNLTEINSQKNFNFFSNIPPTSFISGGTEQFIEIKFFTEKNPQMSYKMNCGKMNILSIQTVFL
jgi:hypothetical protein